MFKKNYFLIFSVFLLVLLFNNFIYAQPLNDNTSTSLSTSQQQAPDSVFKITAKRLTESQAQIEFEIKPNYYLYAKNLKIKSDPVDAINVDAIKFPETLQIPQINNPSKLDDVYTGKFSIIAPIKTDISYPKLDLQVSIQGCDGKTICYPPEVFKFDITNIGEAHQNTNQDSDSIISLFKKLLNGEMSLNQLVSSLSLFQVLLLFFLAGFAISLTPCMYPLYPIALASILGKNEFKLSRVLTLVFTYIHGISIVYILIGFLVSLGGVLLTTAMQTPMFIIAGSIVWLVLGLMMLDLVKLDLPQGLNNYLYSKNMGLTGGNIPSVLLMGVLSALLLGPCVTPPLIAALSIIASANDVLLGMSALYAISLGMGVPILIIALFGSQIMPKSGSWMNIIKYVLGILIIVVAIYLVLPLLVEYNIYLDLSLLSLAIGLIILRLALKQGKKGTHLFQKRLALVSIIFACVFQILAIQDKFWESSFEKVSANHSFITTSSETELNRLIKQSKKPVIIDFYASWCSICREMERTTFKNPEVLDKLSNFTVIKFDLTNNNSEAQKVLRQYDLYGIPALIILDKDNKPSDRFVGFTSSTQLLHALNILKIQSN